MDQPGKVANPACGKTNIPLSPCVPENLVSRNGFSCPVPRQPAHLHTQAESVVNSSKYDIFRKQQLYYYRMLYVLRRIRPQDDEMDILSTGKYPLFLLFKEKSARI